MTVASQHRKPVVIGIVGGIASGKSEVTRLLGESGGTIISADAIAHRVLKETEVIESLVSVFGEQILRQEETVGVRTIDRAVLGVMVFGNDDDKKAMRKKLEAVVHPRIRQAAKSELEAMKRDPTKKMIILDAPLLIEGGWLPYCDRVLMVESPNDLRRNRAIERGWTEQQWIDRESAQLSLEEKRTHATDVLINDGTIGKLHEQVCAFVASLELGMDYPRDGSTRKTPN